MEWLHSLTVGDILALITTLMTAIAAGVYFAKPIKSFFKIEKNYDKIKQHEERINEHEKDIENLKISHKKIDQMTEVVELIGRGMLALIDDRLTGNSSDKLAEIKNEMESRRGFMS